MSTPQKSNASGGGKWKYSTKNETRKLGNAEGDWNLAGTTSSLTRTRLGRRKRDDNDSSVGEEPGPSPTQLFASVAGDDDSTALSSLTGDSSSQSNNKPPPTRVIVEVTPTRHLVEDYLGPCPKCNSKLVLSFPTTCVASGSKICCENEFCTFADIREPAGSSIPPNSDGGSEKIERNTDYAANVLYVLALVSSIRSAGTSISFRVACQIARSVRASGPPVGLVWIQYRCCGLRA